MSNSKFYYFLLFLETEEFVRSISFDPDNIKKLANLGLCHVSLNCVKNKIVMEIFPAETTDFDKPVEGIIISIDENDCHVTSIMEMAKNSEKVEEAKKNKNPIKIFLR